MPHNVITVDVILHFIVITFKLLFTVVSDVYTNNIDHYCYQSDNAIKNEHIKP